MRSIVSNHINQVSIYKDAGGPSSQSPSNTISASSNTTSTSTTNNSINNNKPIPTKVTEDYHLLIDNGDIYVKEDKTNNTNQINFDSATLKMYITYIEITQANLEKEISELKNKRNACVYDTPSDEMRNKYKNLAKYCYPNAPFLSAEDMLLNVSNSSYVYEYIASNYEKYFPNGTGKMTNEIYSQAQIDFKKWIQDVYTKEYNDYYAETVGIKTEEYKEAMAKLEEDLLIIKSSAYALRQQEKQIPYMEISESEEYKQYVQNYESQNHMLTFKGFSQGREVKFEFYLNGEKIDNSKVNPLQLIELVKTNSSLATYFPVSENFKWLTDDEKMMYNYLFDTKGRTEADKYLEAIKDTLNQRRGKAEAEEFIKSISNENGVIERNPLTSNQTAFKGVLDGIETFGEGLNNIFNSDGVMTDNQYAQMYILEALGEQGIMDDVYQLGSSLGNMLPAMAASIIISTIATPASGAVVSNILMGTSSAGNAINQKKIEGDFSWKAYVYGLAMGVSETTLGLLLGNIPFLNANSALCIKGLISEGTEEFIQTYIEAGMNAVLYGEDVDAEMLFGEASKSFIYGVIMSGITNGGQLGFNLISSSGKSVKIETINDFFKYISINNNSDINIVKNANGSKTVVINSKETVDTNLVDKIKHIFPESDIIQKIDNDNIKILATGETKTSSAQLSAENTVNNNNAENISKDNYDSKETIEKTDNSTIEISNTLEYLNEEIQKANYYTQKGNFYTIDVSNFDGISSDFWSQINDPSNVRFRCDGQIYSFLEAKGKAGADPIANMTNNTTTKENISLQEYFDTKASEANYYASKGNFYSIAIESFDSIPSDFWSKINDPTQLFVVKDGKRYSFSEAKELSTVDASIDNAKTEVSKLDYKKHKPTKYATEYLKSNVRKFAYKDTNSFDGLNAQIMENGLYHFTDASDAILKSGYIKASDMNTSYGNKKSFFFNGIPEVGTYATNLDKLPIKTTAVRVQPNLDIVNSSKLKLRYIDDMAITYDGNFSLNGCVAEKCFFILTAENGKLKYKQVSESIYNNYENTNMGQVLSEYTSNKENITSIKSDFLSGISIRNANEKTANSGKIENLLNTTNKKENVIASSYAANNNSLSQNINNKNIDEKTLFKSIVSKIGFDEARKALWNYVYGNDSSLIPADMINDFNSISKEVIEDNFLGNETVSKYANSFSQEQVTNKTVDVKSMSTIQLVTHIKSFNSNISNVKDCISALSDNQLSLLLSYVYNDTTGIYKNIINSMNTNQFIYALNNNLIKGISNNTQISIDNNKTMNIGDLLTIMMNKQMCSDFVIHVIDNYNGTDFFSNYTNSEILNGVTDMIDLLNFNGYNINFDNEIINLFNLDLSKYKISIKDKIYRGKKGKSGSEQGRIARTMNDNVFPIDIGLRKDLINQVKKSFPGISKQEAVYFLQSIDVDRGVCNYADVCNSIFEKYDGNEELFEKTFGFPMYRSDGTLNDAQLLLDMFIYISGKSSFRKKFLGRIFDKSKSNYVSIGTANYRDLTSYVGANFGYRLDYIAYYLKSKGLVKNTSSLFETQLFNSTNKTSSNIFDANSTIVKINNALNDGKHISIAADTGLKLVSSTGEVKILGGPHVMTIYGIDANGNLIVDSWGKEHTIDLQLALSDNIYFHIYSLSLNLNGNLNSSHATFTNNNSNNVATINNTDNSTTSNFSSAEKDDVINKQSSNQFSDNYDINQDISKENSKDGLKVDFSVAEMEEYGLFDYYESLSKYIIYFINKKYPLTPEDMSALVNKETTTNIEKRNNALNIMTNSLNNILHKVKIENENLIKQWESGIYSKPITIEEQNNEIYWYKQQMLEDLYNNDHLITEIIDSLTDNDKFIEVWNKIQNLNSENLNGFSTVKEYKEYIIDKLISSGKIENINPYPYYLIACDNVMVQKLIGTEKFNGFFERNFTNPETTESMCNIFKNLDSNSINQILNNTSIKEYINSLSNEKFKEIITRFRWANLSILSCDTFKDKILNMSNDDFKNIKYEVKNEIYNYLSLTNNSNAIIKEDEITNLDKNSVYTIKYEYNGKVIEKQIEVFGDSKYITSLIDFSISDTELLKAIMTDNFKFISVQKDEVKSALMLSTDDGLAKGLNKITMIINGQEKTLLVGVSDSTIDLNNRFKDVTSAQILGIENIKSSNIEVNKEDAESIYKVEYNRNGVINEYYLTPESLGKTYRVNVDSYLLRNNIYDASDIKIEKIDISNIDLSQHSITNYTSSESIFSDIKYGGNQSNVETLISNYVNSKDSISTEGIKSKILYNMVKEYFPNATDMEIINIARSYANSGCAYMAIANAFCTYMGSIENGNTIFKELYGFDLYINDNGTQIYNYEAVALDIFCNRYKNETPKSIITAPRVDLPTDKYKEVVTKYFSEKGIDVSAEYEFLDSKNMKLSLQKAILNSKDSFKILAASNFDLELIGNDNVGAYFGPDGAIRYSKFDGKIHKDIGGHAMLITEMDQTGDVIVSSWSNKYKFISDSILEHKNNGQKSNAFFWTLKFNMIV